MQDQDQDQKILSAILSDNPPDRDKALRFLFEDKGIRDRLYQYIANHGGTLNDFEDVFQESLVLLYEKIITGRFKGDFPIKSYLFKLATYKYLDNIRLREKSMFSELLPSIVDDQFVENEYLKNENSELPAKIMQEIMNGMSSSCQELLLAFYSGYSMDEIAAKLGYSNVATLRQARYKCLQKLRDLINRDGHLKAILMGREL